MSASEPVFSLDDLRVEFDTPDGLVEAVRDVSLSIDAGECLAVVGESGSGKSQMFLATMGLLAANGRASGSARYRGREILNARPRVLNDIRGAQMTMIFQDPLTSLTPHMTVGAQMRESLAAHKGLHGGEATRLCQNWLERVRISEAARRLNQYPHELSGGMRQRVMIAMSMLCDPDLLIADEPSTALDVTVQAEVLDIMDELKKDTGAAIALITHDMGVVARMADRVQVMRHGEFIEDGPVERIFHEPQSDYARMLLEAMPRLDRIGRPGRAALCEAPDRSQDPFLQARDLAVRFPVRREGGLFGKTESLRAVDKVSFDLWPGETLGVVGESGCGKSTLARAVLRLVPVHGGTVSWMGADLTTLKRDRLRKTRQDLQIVFQDPLASLDPRMSIGASIAEPLKTFRPSMNAKQREAEIRAIMRRVDLDPDMINRYPHELSGGQNQRVGVARAVILKPKLVICDEAVSALDVSVQAQIIDLLIDLQKEMGLSMIFISHDLSVVREVSHRVMVLYLGRVMELADRAAIYDDARHPYTKALISAVPTPDPAVEKSRKRIKLGAEIPSPLDPGAGLRFLPTRRGEETDGEPYRPVLSEVAPGHWVAEHDPLEVIARHAPEGTVS